MPNEQRPNSGVLFKNDRKEQPNHPDYKGQAEVNGQSVWISAWIKEGKSGKFMSLAFSEKTQQQGGKPPPRNNSKPFGDDAGDLDAPF